MNPTVSIVVPVYNADATIERCVCSLIEQTYPSIEIILVNDGSSDNSLNHCKSLQQQDSRIHVITQTNQGLSAARNTGTRSAHGDFISFVDSDDYVDNTFIDDLVKAITSYPNLDIAVGGFKTNNPLFRSVEVPSTKSIETGHNYLSRAFLDPHIYDTVAWTKLYRRELCQKYPFPIGKIHEDEFTYFLFLGASRRVITVPQAHYHYMFNNHGITATENLKGGLDRIEAHRDKLCYLLDHKYPDNVINVVTRILLTSLLILRSQNREVKTSDYFRLIKSRFGNSIIIQLNRAQPFLTQRNSILLHLYTQLPSLTANLYCANVDIKKSVHSIKGSVAM